MPTIQTWQYAAIGVAVLLFTANWWWPWIKGLFVRKTPPAKDLYEHVVALREPLDKAGLFNSVLLAVCGNTEAAKALPPGWRKTSTHQVDFPTGKCEVSVSQQAPEVAP